LRFAVPGLRWIDASPRGHGMPCRDVPCRVHVGVVRMSTGDAAESRLALSRSGGDVPAVGTTLTGERGVDLFDSTGGFLFEASDEQAPAVGENTPVQSGLLPNVRPGRVERSLGGPGHCPDAKVLDSYDGEPPGEIGGGLLHPVLPPVDFAGPKPGDPRLQPGPTIGSAFCPGKSPLQAEYPFGFLGPELWTAQQFAGRQGRRHRHSPVHTYNFSRSGGRRRLGDRGEREMPAARAIHRDPIGHRGRDWPGATEPHPADLRNQNFGPAAVDFTDAHRGRTDNTEALVAAAFPVRRSPAGAGVEVRHRGGEVAQRLLLNGLGAGAKPVELGPGFRQLAALLGVARRCSSARIPPPLLLNGEIEHEACLPAVLDETVYLFRCRVKPVSRHAVILSKKGHGMSNFGRRCLPGLKVGFSTAEPR